MSERTCDGREAARASERTGHEPRVLAGDLGLVVTRDSFAYPGPGRCSIALDGKRQKR